MSQWLDSDNSQKIAVHVNLFDQKDLEMVFFTYKLFISWLLSMV